MLRWILAAFSVLSLALCAMSSYLWIRSMAGNNYWDTPHILHLGGLPAVFVAMMSATAAGALGWLWYSGTDMAKSRRQPRGFPVLHCSTRLPQRPCRHLRGGGNISVRRVPYLTILIGPLG